MMYNSLNGRELYVQHSIYQRASASLHHRLCVLSAHSTLPSQLHTVENFL